MRGSRVVPVASVLALLAAAPASPAGAPHWCGTYEGRSLASVAAHRERVLRQGGVRAAAAASSLDFDADGFAVLIDAGDLVLAQSLFDLSGAGLRLTPAAGGWSVARVDAAPLPDTGNPLALGDDATIQVPLAFAFPFFGTEYREVFVNSDGNLTFGAGDGESTPRDLGRLLDGPPRVAPLLADLNPETNGRITAAATAEALVVTWSEVPQFDRVGQNSFQVVLRPDGSIEMSWSSVVASIEEGVVGVAPGGRAVDFTPLDLSAVGASQVPGSFAESFRDAASLDLVASARRFYATHADDFDQVLFFTSERLVSGGTFAFESNVSNVIRGLGLRQFDDSAAFGSGGRLESVVQLDDLSKYPVDPNAVFLGEDSTLDVIAHEVGHRWLTRVRFRDGDKTSDELLGRQQAHWSFYADTDGSHLEGNDILDKGDGSFETVGASLRYSTLDLYMMGLVSPEAVPPFFFVRNVTSGGLVDPTRSPRTGVSFNGTRVDVTVDDIVAASGARSPAPAPPTRPWRQAFVYVSSDPTLSQIDMDKIGRILTLWGPFFSASTGGLWSVDTHLP